MSTARLSGALLATATTALLLPAAPAAAAAERPRGDYTAQGGQFLVQVVRRAVSLAAFDFGCRKTSGRISITEIPIRKVRGRYRFSIRTYGLAYYRDEHPDENARVRFSGVFSRNAARVTGTFEVRSPHCGSTGSVMWSARR